MLASYYYTAELNKEVKCPTFQFFPWINSASGFFLPLSCALIQQVPAANINQYQRCLTVLPLRQRYL